MNVPAILCVFRAIRDPSISLPHYTISNFSQLPVPLTLAFSDDRAPKTPYTSSSTSSLSSNSEKRSDVDIRGVVLDKDNCIAVPHTERPVEAYTAKLQELIATYTAANVLIVSNSSGLASVDRDGASAARLETNTGLSVLRHIQRKPARECGDEIKAYFAKRGIQPHQICVIGDRLFTDVVMGNGMGAWTIWVKEGVVRDTGLVTKLEYSWEKFVRRRQFASRRPVMQGFS